MITNPYNSDLEDLKKNLAYLKEQQAQCSSQLAKFGSYDFDTASAIKHDAKRQARAAYERLQPLQQQLKDMDAQVGELTPPARLGFDPRYWFSSARSLAKQALASAKAQQKALSDSLTACTNEYNAFTDKALGLQKEIAAARAFDVNECKSTIRVLGESIGQMLREQTQLQTLKTELDHAIAEPMKALKQLQSKREDLNHAIYRAEYFEDVLRKAANSAERRIAHVQCEDELGDSKPGKVLNRSRGELRTVEASIHKLERRLKDMIEKAKRRISHVVIDGNNLCYEGRAFIGLMAIEALVPQLSERFEVSIVFDASIRRRLQTNDQGIAKHFPSAKRVHIVASKQQADETVLALADGDPTTYILSNDRFADFPERDAVFQGRMIRHEIVAGAVHVHDLSIKADFKPAATFSRAM